MNCHECDDFGDALDDVFCRVCFAKAERKLKAAEAENARLAAEVKRLGDLLKQVLP